MPRIFQSLKAKVVALFIALIIVSVGALVSLGYFSTRSVLVEQSARSMRSILEFRVATLEGRIAQISHQAGAIAAIEALQKSMVNLKSGWKTLDKKPGDAAAALRNVFIAKNLNPAGEREKLVKPEGPSGYYFSAHEELQPEVKKLLASSPFSDLLIVDGKGNVVYSYKKDETFAANLADAAWASTGLGALQAKTVDAVKAAQSDDVAPLFSGIGVDANTGSAEVYFAAPLLNLGAHRGTFMFRVKDEVLASVLSMAIPAGGSEQASIVTTAGDVITPGADDRLKSAGRLSADDMTGLDAFGRDIIRADGAAKAFALPMEIDGARYHMAESVLTEELDEGSFTVAEQLTLLGLAVLVAAAALAGLILSRMFRPLVKLAQVTETVAAGRLDTVIDGAGRPDEIGVMSRALVSFRDKLVRQQAMEGEAEAARRAEEEARLARLAEQEREAATLQGVVDALGEGLTRMAKGDIAFAIDTRFPPSLDSLRQNFNASMATLADALQAIRRNSLAVRAGSDEMREGADQLAERTERQSVAISETVSAINEIVRSVDAQKARAGDATRIAREAASGTERSAHIMENAVRAMEAIQNSSTQINSIISVIDEIAFQTNLLALNAGVEAARAGESGKGFAVVAQEVRELAQRSARAAKEITDLLNKSTLDVQAGVELVEKAGEALQSIGGYVGQINGRIEEIMTATAAEAETLGHISSSVNAIDGMTQQNAAMVEETTAAIHQLAREASEMDGRIAQFRLEADEARRQFRRAG
ncbi:HAMP domain-containing methyl-accepting chemotaxis protein [Rhizobium sp. FKL33]|uniref:methyl-accepting chemotaxis protein n=1 Tax=Rhizobium sp. FKL33 TaxID=2562307 RepID=UPI0010C0F61C|nr:HAMP domain-containing methyl-accepting chemotaxis protein [Rhizobium sp. FKL33]